MIAALNKKRGEEGFTLIELLIVIVILGILAAIVVFAVGTTGQNAAASSCKADAKSIEVALEAFKAQNTNVYPVAPTSPADSTVGTKGWGALLNIGNATGAPFLRQVPSTAHYQLWWDSVGQVWVGAPGSGVYSLAPVSSGASNQNFDSSGGAACDAPAGWVK
jgi:prepilin-type N-terminal cleavage/methylation domain-containing protein